MSDRQLQSAQALHSLVQDTFCLDQVDYAFGYGSGVFQQGNESYNNNIKKNDTPLVDLILVVNDAKEFHRVNLERNAQHYWIPPLFKQLSTIDTQTDWVTWLQRHSVVRSNPRLHFNVTDTIKYGIVQKDDLLQDLNDWRYIYLAGRMHKPILPFIDKNDNSTSSNGATQTIQKAQSQNLHAAICCSLLLQPQSDVKYENLYNLYTRIASLSYSGDPRVAAQAEDPQKIQKLVQDNQEQWDKLYGDSIDKLQRKGILDDTSTASARSYLWQQLPHHFRSVYNLDQFATRTTTTTATIASQIQHEQQLLSKALRSTVASSSRYQSIKGLVTAGPVRSWAYAMRKLSKGLLKR